LTPEEFTDWQEERPDWISHDTAVIAACIKDIADFLNYDIGPAIRAKKNGDAMWYTLTDADGIGLLVLMCTPHAIFTESTMDSTFSTDYGMVNKPLKFLEHLQNSGVRRLTPDEFDDFIQGVF
jgi:hypothetical protein